MKKGNNNYDPGEKQVDRKTIEKNRRIHMKSLCFKLTSLIPSHHFHPSKEQISQVDQLDQVATYIKRLQERVEQLKEIKKGVVESAPTNLTNVYQNRGSIMGLRPIVEITEIDSSLQVILITGVNKNFMLYEAITIIEEAGGEVIAARYSIIGDKIFHTLHAQAKVSRVGVETSWVSERLQELITS